jgi:tetratricopeptide (TPR) repeat protein
MIIKTRHLFIIRTLHFRRNAMSRCCSARLLLVSSLLLGLLSGCSRDPNVRKQKYFDSGERYFAEGKYREAAIQYSNATLIDTRFAQAHYKLSQAYLKLGDMQRAFQELNRTVELTPDNYHAHTDLANLLVTVRNPDGSASPDALKQAKTHLDLLRDKQPNSPETHEAWANYYGAQNNLTAALQEAQQTINLDPTRSESYLLMALLQLRSNMTDQAEANFKKAVESNPKAMNAQLALGGFYQSHSRLMEAEQQFRHAIEIEPKDSAPRAALVRLLMQEGKRDDAEALLKQTKRDLADSSEGYRMLGDFYFAIGDTDKAAGEYASLYREHPKDILVKKNYVQILILKKQLDEAAKLNNEILKSTPHDLEALVYKGEIQLQQNNAAAAVESLQSALKSDPNFAVAHYQLGLAFAQQRDLRHAESEWREAVRIKPDLTDAQRLIANLEISRGEIDAVMQTADQIIQSQSYSPDGYLIRSLAEVAREKYAAAEKDAEEARVRAPQSSAPYYELGNVQLAQKHFPEAEKYFQQALEKDPSSSDALSGLMNTYVAQKEYDKAIAAANVQIAKSPNTSNFYDLLATALFDGKKDYAGAEAALEKSTALDKNNVDALEKLGKVQAQQGSLDKALATYLQASKDNPGEVRFCILAGELYEAKQSWDQAKAMYQQALNLSPDNPLASNNLAYVLLEQGGNVDVAMGMAQTARRGMPNSPNAADTLGWAYYHKGIYQSAISQFQEALRLNERAGAPDDSVLHYHLGLAYQKANQLSLARQQLEKALKIKPDNANARKALSELRS